MATLQNIRKRGPLVAIIIGFAMVAFILGDFINQGSSLFSGDQFRVAEINDVTIDYQEYDQKIKEATELYKQRMNIPTVDERLREQIKQQVWEDMVHGIIMSREYEKLGIAVSSDELFDLVQGKNIDPMIRQIPAFTNQQTGMFDPALVVRFLKSMEQQGNENSKISWLALEDEIIQKQLNRKYTNLILKGLYFTKKRIEKEFADRNHIVDFDYVATQLNEVKDEEIKISDKDVQDYYNKHEKDFEQEASRDIAYVTFKIEPSKTDTSFTEEWINKVLKDFSVETDKEENIMIINSDSDVSFKDEFYKKGEYSNVDVDSILFSSDVNTVYGPYLEDGSYKLAKLLEIKNLPDSIEVEHILIQPDGKTIVDINQAKTVADSLKTAINNGVEFGEVAKNYSADKKSGEKGGKMGWFTQKQNAAPFPITPYNMLVDSSLNKIYTFEYNYGVHLIKVTKRGKEFKKIQIGVIERTIEASSETYQIAYAKASKFAGENRNLAKFDKAIEENGLVRKIAPGVTQSETFIAGLESPREMVRWAFKAEKGDVTEKVFEFGKNYVVAVLTEIREKGIAPINQVKQEIELIVGKEKKKAVLRDKIAKIAGTDIETLASKLSKEVKEARNISFTSFQIPGMGYEPKVIATAISLEKDKMSEPIVGENGVYVIKVKSITPSPKAEEISLTAEKQKLVRDMRQRTMQQIYKALKNSSEITDERSKFY